MLIFSEKKARNYAYDMLIFVGKIWYMVQMLTQNSKIDRLLLEKRQKLSRGDSLALKIREFWKCLGKQQ